MAFSCELPEELARIVKAFAQPAFVHWRLFKQAKKVVPKRHWADLSAALSVRDADNVCEALSAYISASHANALATKELYEYQVSVGDTGAYWSHETLSVIRPILTEEEMEIKQRLVEANILTRSNESKHYRALLVEIHGEPTVEYAEYLDRRRDRYGWNDYGAPLTLRDWDEDEDEANYDEDDY
jgi:hypothetical protein